MMAHATLSHSRKSDPVTLGLGALATGRRWLVRAVHQALAEEGLCDA